MKEITFRSYIEGDEEGIVNLLSNIYGGWPILDLNCSQLEHWIWKYLDNPESNNIIRVAESDKKVVGCFHTIPLNIKIKDSVFPAAYGADYAVHPDFRRKMVSRTLSTQGFEDEKEAGIRLHYSITGNPILIKAVSRRHNRFPYTIKNLVRIRDINMQLKKMPVNRPLLRKTGYYTSKLSTEIKNRLRLKKTNGEYEVAEIEKFDERINAFWEEASKNHNFIIERKMDYLNWRYCDLRAGNYSVRQISSNDEIQGYSVLCINRFRPDYPVGYIVDVLSLPERHDVLNELITDAMRYFDDNDVNIINSQVIESHPYERIFQTHGFLDSRFKIYVFYNTLGYENPFTNNSSQTYKAHITWGDHDVLPVTMPKYA